MHPVPPQEYQQLEDDRAPLSKPSGCLFACGGWRKLRLGFLLGVWVVACASLAPMVGTDHWMQVRAYVCVGVRWGSLRCDARRAVGCLWESLVGRGRQLVHWQCNCRQTHPQQRPLRGAPGPRVVVPLSLSLSLSLPLPPSPLGKINIVSKQGASSGFGNMGLWRFCGGVEEGCQPVRSGGVCDNLNFLKPYFRSYCDRVNYVTGGQARVGRGREGGRWRSRPHACPQPQGHSHHAPPCDCAGLLVTSLVLSVIAIPFLVRHLLKPRATFRSWLHAVALIVTAAGCVATLILVRGLPPLPRASPFPIPIPMPIHG